MELQDSKLLWFLQDDIEVPCIMQWRLLWYPAQSHLNHVLINVGVFQAFHDNTIKKAILRPRSTALHGKGTPRSVIMEARKGGRGGQKGTCKDGRRDLVSENVHPRR